MLMPMTAKAHVQNGSWIHHDGMNHLAEACVQEETWKRYSGPDPVEGLLQQVRRDLSLDASIKFTLISSRPGERYPPALAPSDLPSGL